MRLLVLGGSSFVGRSVVEEGLGRGWTVSTFNRGRGPWTAPGVERLIGDRLDPGDLVPLTSRAWDLAVDTWSGAPRGARESARALVGRVERYVYVSSASVYAPPPPLDGDEDAPTVRGAPDAGPSAYAESKRGAEIAIEAAFGDRALLARVGLILGPHEDVGRLPWWLLRAERGGEVLAPGPADLPLQYVDARDLARWLLDAAGGGLAGPVNVAGRPGHATMRGLLEACRSVTGGNARLTWVDPGFVEAAGIAAWTELPIWLPPGHEDRGMQALGVERAHAAGLHCRPVKETVHDTWRWLREIGGRPPLRADLAPPGLAPDKERAVLAAWRGR